ncbi:MAG TPA: penicillin acylase family protein [Anaerolineae bacterium]|nr:penicillin acylase family protein [Anaerolineae bacterium]
MSSRRLSQLDGRIYLPGLRQPVSISRDHWGIPTIRAENRADLFLAQGFIHAQERLWQMEIHRRAASGQLAAIVGETGLETDRFSRTLGFPRLAQSTWDLTSETVRTDILAYTAGINAFLKTDRPLPVEFSLLRHTPEPWTPLDSVAFSRLMAWTLSHGFANKLTRAQLIEKVGSEAAAELELHYPKDNPVTLPQGIEFNLFEPGGLLRAVEGPFIGRFMAGRGRGSNAWVINGNRTASGHPILCNDMHLPISTPSLWYVLHMHCPESPRSPGLHVAGASLPGLPYVLVGHNEYIAWGATVSFVDNEDLFVERFSPDHVDQYEFEGSWRRADIIEEKIKIRNRPAIIEQVVVTHHGPLITPVLPSNGQVLALASRSLAPNSSFDGFAMLNEARHWDEFVSAVQRIESPALNLVYADTTGNIGYYVTGRVPIRRSGTGQVPVPGWTGEHEWIGDVPFEEMPHAFNPSAGFLVTANNRIVRDDYPHFLGAAWRNGYRARRVTDLIGQKEELTLADSRRFQSDLYSIPGRELVNRLEGLSLKDEEAVACLALLRAWDGRMDAEGAGGVIYKTLVGRLSKAILQPRLGESLTEIFLGAGPHPVLYPFGESHSQWIAVLFRLLDQEESFWLPPAKARIRILEQGLASTMRELRDAFGDDATRWTWGKNHQILFGHSLSAQPPLDQVFNVGPFIVGGDADTVCQMSISPGDGANNIAPSYRQVIDLGDWNSVLVMHAPGQSGHLASPHYADLAEPWLKGDYYRLNWTEAATEAAAYKTLQLLPPIAVTES